MISLNEADREWLRKEIVRATREAREANDAALPDKMPDVEADAEAVAARASAELRDRLIVAAVRALSRKIGEGWTHEEIAEDAVSIADATLRRRESPISDPHRLPLRGIGDT